MAKLLWTMCFTLTYVVCQSKPCCFPEQLEAKLRLLMGTVDVEGIHLLTGYLAMSFDAKGERIYIDEDIEVDKVKTRITILQLYKEKELGTQYYVENNATCIKSSLPPWNGNCIPGNATHGNQYRLGMTSSINVLDYEWAIENLGYRMTVTSDSCVPTFEQVIGSATGTNLMGTYTFENVTSGIKDPHVFDMPRICEKFKVIEDKVPRRGFFPFPYMLSTNRHSQFNLHKSVFV